MCIADVAKLLKCTAKDGSSYLRDKFMLVAKLQIITEYFRYGLEIHATTLIQCNIEVIGASIVTYVHLNRLCIEKGSLRSGN